MACITHVHLVQHQDLGLPSNHQVKLRISSREWNICTIVRDYNPTTLTSHLVMKYTSFPSDKIENAYCKKLIMHHPQLRGFFPISQPQSTDHMLLIPATPPLAMYIRCSSPILHATTKASSTHRGKI